MSLKPLISEFAHQPNICSQQLWFYDHLPPIINFTEEIQESHLGISLFLFELIAELKMCLWSHSVFHESQKKVVSLMFPFVCQKTGCRMLLIVLWLCVPKKSHSCRPLGKLWRSWCFLEGVEVRSARYLTKLQSGVWSFSSILKLCPSV